MLFLPAVTSFPWDTISWGGGCCPTVVTKLPGRASHPLKKNCDLHFFPKWQAFPGVREASDSRKTRTILFLLDFFCGVLSPHPYRLLLGTPTPWSRGSRGRGGIRVPASRQTGLLDPGLQTHRSLFSFLPPSIPPATHIANEEPSRGQKVNTPRTAL